jgi:hypothetical protein
VTTQFLFNKALAWLIGEAATQAVISADGPVTLKRLNKHRRRLRRLKRELRANPLHLACLHSVCTDHLRPITAPLALISEIQRSGGSLLSQLFDGHPELHAHPHEIKFGFPRKFNWPPIDLNDPPERWFDLLFETSTINHFKEGYRKQKNSKDTFPFIFLPSVQKEIFLKFIEKTKAASVRDVFDAYMTSYFGAWLNNQNIAGDKKYITGFTARLAMYAENVESFFQIYPEGRLISIIRDPKNWYPSAANHKPLVYADLNDALTLWMQSAQSMIRNKKIFDNRVCLLTFEDVIGRTESVMQYLSRFLNIDFDRILLTPTFNKWPIRANTSFVSKSHGIIDQTLYRYQALDKADLAFIDEKTGKLYSDVLKETVSF